MKYKLKDIALIQSGIFAKTDVMGNVIYLQAKYFDEQGSVNSTLHPDLKLQGKIDKHLLLDGDILFAAKGTKNFAVRFHQDIIGLAVASSTFIVIRVNSRYKNLLTPEYLQWYINHPNTLQILKGRAIGTDLPSISKAVLENLDIDIPPLEKQLIILKINELRNKEITLKRQLENIRGLEIQQKLFKAANYNYNGQ